MIDDDAAEGLLAASSSENGQRMRGEELDGRDSRDSFVSTGSVDSASDAELSGKARCVQLAAFVVCFALTFVLSFFLVQLASEQGMDISQHGNSSSTWRAVSMRSMVRKRAAFAGRSEALQHDSSGEKTSLNSTAVSSVSSPGGDAWGNLRKNIKPAPKLTSEIVSAADNALEEDMNILEKMKTSRSNSDNVKILDKLSINLENTTTLLGGDARLKADTQMVKELRQTLSGRARALDV